MVNDGVYLVITSGRLEINWLWLSILLVVRKTGKMDVLPCPFAPKGSISRMH